MGSNLAAVGASLLLIASSSTHAGDLNLPPVTPDFCSKRFCVHVSSHRAVEKFISSASAPHEIAPRPDTISVIFQGGTAIAFAAVPSRGKCDTGLSKKWVNEGNSRSTAFLCLQSVRGIPTVVAVTIKSTSPYELDEFQGVSEICAWGISLDRVESGGKSVLPLGPEKCVGDRLGWANPPIENQKQNP